ncbi:hypothetical protein Tco_1066374 [Tanacetum coccineum]|uniref:Uncharacterized protein n=1 Tax=Tanacetum coccineum TaxID=301880 RepID=A0ABQ5HBL9_9ASTR
MTSGTAFIATAPTVGLATLGPPAPTAGLVLLEPSASPAVAAALVVLAAAAALATSVALAAATVHFAASVAATLSAIIRSIAALLILSGGMILLITKDVGGVLVPESIYHLDLEFSLFDPYPLLLKWQKYWLTALGSSTSESPLSF